MDNLAIFLQYKDILLFFLASKCIYTRYSALRDFWRTKPWKKKNGHSKTKKKGKKTRSGKIVPKKKGKKGKKKKEG